MNVGNYHILSSLGSGSYGAVYNGSHILTKAAVAIKFSLDKDNLEINNEIKCYLLLKNNPHIPKLKTIGKLNNYCYLVIERLDVSLEKLQTLHISFSPEQVCMWGLQLVDCLEAMHLKGIVHRDLKPGNILLNKKQNKLYICDFGMASLYRTSKQKHIKKYNVQIGSTRYMSINSHNMINPVRKDDLESIGYILWELLEGTLPWKNKNKNKAKKLKLITKPISTELELFINHCKNLSYDECPNYLLLKAYLKRLTSNNT